MHLMSYENYKYYAKEKQREADEHRLVQAIRRSKKVVSQLRRR